jgi:hypothetical protein
MSHESDCESTLHIVSFIGYLFQDTVNMSGRRARALFADVPSEFARHGTQTISVGGRLEGLA